MTTARWVLLGVSGGLVAAATTSLLRRGRWHAALVTFILGVVALCGAAVLWEWTALVPGLPR